MSGELEGNEAIKWIDFFEPLLEERDPHSKKERWKQGHPIGEKTGNQCTRFKIHGQECKQEDKLIHLWK